MSSSSSGGASVRFGGGGGGGRCGGAGWWCGGVRWWCGGTAAPAAGGCRHGDGDLHAAAAVAHYAANEVMSAGGL